jgi:prepilin-type N-terminal cleavage/methylation domain-containing protein
VRLWRAGIRHPGAAHRPGFSIVELLFVVVIAGILSAFAVPQISKYTSRRDALNARDAFILTGARARAAALQTGAEVRMRIDPTNHRVLIVDAGNNPVEEPFDLLVGPVRGRIVGTREVVVCYTPRGFARPGCPPADDSIVGFASPAGRDTAWARITMGRMERR